MQIIRRLLERGTHGWVVRRRLPAEFGHAPIYVSPSARLAYLVRGMSAVDPSLLAFVRLFVHPGAVVWDVGANVGLCTFAAAARAGSGGSVLSIEPDTWLVSLLRRTSLAQAATSAPVTIVPCAISSRPSLSTFCVASRSRAASALEGFDYRLQTGGVNERHTVVTVTLDWLLGFAPPPTVLKIDVEGAELEVLRGSTHLFEIARPVVLCEVSSSFPEVTAYFHSRRYALFDGQQVDSGMIGVSSAAWSTIAVPQ